LLSHHLRDLQLKPRIKYPTLLLHLKLLLRYFNLSYCAKTLDHYKIARAHGGELSLSLHPNHEVQLALVIPTTRQGIAANHRANV
jgi:hypothetical protein